MAVNATNVTGIGFLGDLGGGDLLYFIIPVGAIIVIGLWLALRNHHASSSGGGSGGNNNSNPNRRGGSGGNGGNNGGGSNPRPPGPMPPPSPRRGKADDPPTPDTPPPGIDPTIPYKKPHVPSAPKKPKIPDDKEIYIDLSPDFMPIRSQDKLGACTAFAATSIFEYILNITNNVRKYLSPLFLWYKTREDLGMISQNHGPPTITIPLKNLIDDGVSFEELWSFTDHTNPKWQQAPDQPAERDALSKHIIRFYSLDRNDPDQWVQALLDKNPINIAVDVFSDFRPLSDRLYIRSPAAFLGGHAMVIVGYHSHYPHNGQGIKAFKVRNSWGVDWADNGYVWIPADVLVQLLKEEPFIIEGWQKKDSKEVKCKIAGRVFWNDSRANDATGKEINNLKLPEDKKAGQEPFVIEALAQINGQITVLASETYQFNRNQQMRFELQFEADPTEFQPPTKLTNQVYGLNGLDLSKFPGVVVCKYHPGEKETWCHVVNMNISELGRGGEGIHNHPENPRSDRLHQNNFSGIPIMFDEKHDHEENVVIPIYDFGSKPQPSADPKIKEIFQKLNKFKQETENWAGTEDKFLKDALDAAVNQKSNPNPAFSDLESSVKQLGRAERKANTLEHEVLQEIESLVEQLSDHELVAKITPLLDKLKVLWNSVLVETSRYKGHIKEHLENIKTHCQILKRARNTNKKSELERQISALWDSFLAELNQTKTWVNGLQAELKIIDQLEADYLAKNKRH